jgi:hypothetical protein
MAITIPLRSRTTFAPTPLPADFVPVRDEDGDSVPILTRAETAECTCPDFCERDHANE